MDTLDHIIVTDLLKATPAMEEGRRFVYIEASNENRDVQGEIVLAKALEESRDYYLRYGNLDLDHLTQIGQKMGVQDYHFYEIGRPVDVRIGRGTTFVKGELYQGDGKSAARANDFWDSITGQQPPQRWFPSVGGSILGRDPNPKIGPDGKTAIVNKVRWSNIGFSKTPVNCTVDGVSTVPIGMFAKSLTAEGHLDRDVLHKMLTAGYGSDSSGMSGGRALSTQSLDGIHAHGVPSSYWDYRDRMAGALRKKLCKANTPKDVADYSRHEFKLSSALASEWAERFIHDFARSIHRS